MWCPRRAHTPGHGFASGASSKLGNRARASRANVSTVPASTASANATQTWRPPDGPDAATACGSPTRSSHPHSVAASPSGRP